MNQSENGVTVRPEEAVPGLRESWYELRRGQQVAVVCLCGLLLAGSVAYWAVSRPGKASLEVSGAPAAAAGASEDSGISVTTTTISRREVVVHVAGSVKAPGLYRLKEGDRVAEAIEAAGGLRATAATEAINLASKLMDGQKIMVPDRAAQMSPGAAPGQMSSSAVAAQSSVDGGSLTSGGDSQMVNLNTATLADLDTLPGVGPTLAQRILDFREKNGGYRSVDDLREVDGIGEKRFSELKAKCTV